VKLGLIFDLDGTLVDSLDGIAASLNWALAQSYLPGHPRESVRKMIGNGARVLVERAVPADSAASLVDRVEAAFKVDYDRTWPTGTVPYAGIPELLQTLHARGYPLAVLSNKPHAFTEAIVAQVFPNVTFSVVLGQRTGIPHKPDPSGAFEIARLLNLPPKSCAIIGDSSMDIETARNAGMAAIAVTWGFQDAEWLTSHQPSRMVTTPAELDPLFPSDCD
jgi:phosphoglycolate phosphatase